MNLINQATPHILCANQLSKKKVTCNNGLQHMTYIKNAGRRSCMQMGFDNCQILVKYRHQMICKMYHFTAFIKMQIVESRSLVG